VSTSSSYDGRATRMPDPAGNSGDQAAGNPGASPALAQVSNTTGPGSPQLPKLMFESVRPRTPALAGSRLHGWKEPRHRA